MITTRFQDKILPQLGFGAMRLPLTVDGAVDEKQVREMVAYAMAHGVNYFDTAFPYHGGESERVLGRILKDYDRESYYLATKYPGHQLSERYDPAEVFEEQLKKCGVDYFDFYLLHNVYEKSMEVYLDSKWGILDYFREQKRLGRIRHLGFSSHGRVDNLCAFLDACGEDMEFCQIQLNYLDWTLQEAGRKYEILRERNIPIWVMEPVRGGRLAAPGEDAIARMKQARSDTSPASWAFRFLQDLPGVSMVLSGMSNMAQMVDNVATFEAPAPLSEAERAMLFDIAESMKNSVPCTACRYCCDGCPAGLDIPLLLSAYNEIRFSPTSNVKMRVEAIPEEKQPASCIGCGACAAVCPQNIDIPGAMTDFVRILGTIPSWAEICREREAAARRGRG